MDAADAAELRQRLRIGNPVSRGLAVDPMAISTHAADAVTAVTAGSCIMVLA